VVDTEPWTAEARATAKALFGSPTRVVLGAWILARKGEAFFQQEAQDALRLLGEPPTGVRLELVTFVESLLLDRFPDGRRLYFVQKANPIWSVYESLSAAFNLPARLSVAPPSI